MLVDVDLACFGAMVRQQSAIEFMWIVQAEAEVHFEVLSVHE